ncbi:MFS transporter [Prauserella marina]|uniref:Predicted arabinose efflux permease, MFS family n=1 Tax=Prauserella marina TaxID=530584 RepID=A0A222VLL0_9PSEU|nr:MFS transporter [Prauserella marina]ASR34643.1 MFS transporter [Prauserella marina]PWV85713.1 putative MFS family arabinose efflux permease [Prauserella marina]SDC47590.1 Predicted arabinose efflux permease, MFS family [Prauserella marina]
MTQARERRPAVLWTPEHRATTAGLLLVVTLIAFENLGVATAMPTMVADLDGTALYSWPFTAFLVASVAATVLSGRLCDLRGPVPSLLVGPAVFLAGLLVAGAAPTMEVLLAGRFLQGLGTGTLLVATSVLIALVFTDRERPVIYAANAAAWVLPAVLGPPVAGLVTVHFGWRWVFLGLAPLVPVGVALLIPALRRITRAGQPDGEGGGRRASVWAAVSAALGIAALTWAAQHPSSLAAGYGLAELVLLAAALRTLLPRGTSRARSGLPALVASRALLAGSFAGMEAFLPLTMTGVHGYGPALAGMPLTTAAVSWSAASVVQGRKPDWRRESLVRAGFCFLAVGLALFTAVSQAWCPGWVAFVGAAAGGAGMGIALPSISVLLLRLSPVAERGFNTSALQLGDWVASALAIGLGGVLLGALASAAAPGPSVAVLGALLAASALLGVVMTGRRAA